MKKKVILFAGGPIRDQMAGPAIRSWEMAASLSRHFDILLVTPNQSTVTPLNFHMIWKKDPALKKALKECEGILTQGIEENPFKIIFIRKPILIDLYIPYWFELLEMEGKMVPLNKYLMEKRIHLLLKRGDFFICASEKQRDLWLGALAALGRLSPNIYQEDRLGKSLIDIVPFGIPEIPPKKEKEVVKGKIIRPTDKLILWNGGLWAWLDPLTLIKAVGEIRKHRDDIKLLFLGTHYPNPGSVEVEILDRAINLAKVLGLYSNTVFFNDVWIPYDQRQDYLLEAGVGVSLHGKTLESVFSFRTRLLDCLWATLPIVCTEGDHFADLVEREGLGIVVKPEDVERVRDGILKILDDIEFNKKCKENLERVARDFTWSQCIKPIESFFSQPKRKTKRSFLSSIFLLISYLAKIFLGNLIYRFKLIHDAH
jgi:glycosyltransferase involved in cell wall biosynthesis